jgi:cytochrome b
MTQPPMPIGTATDQRSSESGVRVWDVGVRIGHWGLVLAVIGSFTTHYVGDRVFWLHVWCGYVVLTLVISRSIWGVIGTRYARFAQFVRGPRAVWASRLELFPRHHRPMVGHTPVGGWMILLLLTVLGAQALTGLFANDAVIETGPLMGYVSMRLSNRLSQWHEWLSFLIIALVTVHVLAAFYYRWVLRDDVITPLITGKKRHVAATEGIPSAGAWGALAILLLVAAVLAWLILRAPAAPDLLMG